MHALFVTASISDYDAAQKELHEEGIPMVSQAPGFVAGYWLRPVEDGKGNSVIVFDSEEAAERGREGLEQNPPREVTIDSIEIREVAGHA